MDNVSGYYELLIASIRLALKDRVEIDLDKWGDLFGLSDIAVEKMKKLYKEKSDDTSWKLPSYRRR